MTKKLISAFLCLIMLISLFSCENKKAPVSFGTNSEPNSLTEEQKQYFLDCYNKEHNTSLKIENVDPIWKHYGTYNGCVVVFQDVGDVKITDVKYGSHVFRHYKDFNIITLKDGALKSFEKALADGWITEENIDTIFAYHNETALPDYKFYDIACPENAAPGELSEDVMKQFTAAFEKLGYNASLIHHYGTYNGITLFYKDGEVKNNGRFYMSVVFDHDHEVLYTDKDYSEMIIFKDGYFEDGVHYFTVNENNSYNLPVYGLTKENVNTIVQYHESRLPDELKRVIIEYPEKADPATLPADKLSLLLNSFRARHDSEADTILHYGTEKGILILLIYGPNDDPKEIDPDKDLVLYENGNFMPIGDYESRNISSLITDAITEAKNYHESITD